MNNGNRSETVFPGAGPFRRRPLELVEFLGAAVPPGGRFFPEVEAVAPQVQAEAPKGGAPRDMAFPEAAAPKVAEFLGAAVLPGAGPFRRRRRRPLDVVTFQGAAVLPGGGVPLDMAFPEAAVARRWRRRLRRCRRRPRMRRRSWPRQPRRWI
jgi:hypothetical protein